MSACPSDEQLQLLIDGSVSNRELQPLEAHCRECRSCQLRLGNVRSELIMSPEVRQAFAAFNAVPCGEAPRPTDGAAPDGNRTVSFDSIPGYELLDEIQRGGQGVVYQAIQKATKRRVAVKVLLAGPFSGPSERARFEREVQMLAALKHPHVVAIHDSGSAAGNFYFVMDYIDGRPLDEYVQEEKLGVRDTLALFAKVCDAVNAAHLRGIMHRDLKPDNVRVDAEGSPHVLDFGLARVVPGQPVEESQVQPMTLTGQFVGSPPWASPEQAEGAPDGIDLRTDVYSLGVILFQVLTGQFPYDVTGSIWTILGNIRSSEPTKPRALRREIDDEVETMVLKCLAKERERRYQSAGDLARDLRRYLAGEPVEAKRDSTGYLMRKTLRRHRWALSAGILVAASIVMAAVVALVFGYQAVQDRKAADAAQRLAEDKSREAETARREAELQTQEAMRRLYTRQIALAEQALKGDGAPLRKLLRECPEELRGWEWSWLWRVSDASQAVLRADTADMVGIAYSPDGQALVSVGNDGMIRVWDSVSGAPRQVLKAQHRKLLSVAYRPTEDMIAVGDLEGGLECWNLATGQQLWARTNDRPQEATRAIAYSADGSKMAAEGDFRVINIWDGLTGELLFTMPGHSNSIMALAFSPDGRLVASASSDNTVRIWELQPQLVGVRVLEGHQGPVFSVAFSPDGRVLASASEDATVRLHDVETGKLLKTLTGHTMAINAVAFSPDGTRLLTAARDATVRLWEATTGSELKRFRGHEGSVVRAVFSPDGHRFATSSGDRTVRLWDPDAETGERVLLTEAGRCYELSLSSDGRTLAVAADAGILLWDLDAGRELFRIEDEELRADERTTVFGNPHHPPDDTGDTYWHFDRASLSADGMRVAVFGCRPGRLGPKVLRVWDVARASELWSTGTIDTGGSAVQFSPDGRFVAAPAEKGTALIREAETGDVAVTIAGHDRYVTNVAFSPDGRRVATAGHDDRIVKLWDASTGQLLRTYEKSPQPVVLVTFTPKGDAIASYGDDGALRLWSVDSGEDLIAPIEFPATLARGLIFSPDGRRLVTAGIDARIWDLGTGELLMRLGEAPTAIYNDAAFSADGQRLVVCGGSGLGEIHIRDAPGADQRIEE